MLERARQELQQLKETEAAIEAQKSQHNQLQSSYGLVPNHLVRSPERKAGKLIFDPCRAPAGAPSSLMGQVNDAASANSAPLH